MVRNQERFYGGGKFKRRHVKAENVQVAIFESGFAAIELGYSSRFIDFQFGDGPLEHRLCFGCRAEVGLLRKGRR